MAPNLFVLSEKEFLTHCPARKKVLGSLHVPESEFELGKAVSVPVKKGDDLLMAKDTISSSPSNTESQLHDPVVWNELWPEARSALAKGEEPPFNRCYSGHTLCA